MTKRAVITIGDTTSHGGTVTEGFAELRIHGKAAAGVGHQGSCPKCKTTFYIVAGAANVNVFGRALALEGMMTSCGAVLIASQNYYMVDDGIDAASDAPSATQSAAGGDGAAASAAAVQTYDEQFTFRDESTGKPLAGVPYKATSSSGKIFMGTTDAGGRTQRMKTATGETLTLAVQHGGNA